MKNYKIKCAKHGSIDVYGDGTIFCPACDLEMDETEQIKFLTNEFITLENFFAQRENGVPKYPVGHAITIIKLQDDKIKLLQGMVDFAIRSCPCSIKERDSGHTINCFVPTLNSQVEVPK